MAAAAWCAADPAERPSNRQFLAMFAIYLVKHFRAEETRLDRAAAPDRAWHRMEHRRLVRQLRDVMMDLDLGLEVTAAIHGFLDAWRLHQESVSPRRAPTGSLGH
jgi:hemerythrin